MSKLCLRMDMQTAFLFAVIFPPPSAGPEIFASPDGPGTGFAANTDKTFIMEAVVGNIMLVDKSPGLFCCPVKDRMEF